MEKWGRGKDGRESVLVGVARRLCGGWLGRRGVTASTHTDRLTCSHKNRRAWHGEEEETSWAKKG